MNNKPLPPDGVPILFERVGEATADYPTLTVMAEESPALAPSFNPQIAPELLHELEVHLDSLVAQKLQQYLADAQQQAIALALAEIRAEIPGLIRKTLDSFPK
ncbi:MAG: hypothetical protein AAB278_07975 [Pseudomonadota bacterium]